MYSFGDRRYEQYNDKIGYYKDYNHYDKQRGANYNARHKHDKLNTYSSAYISMRYLWWIPLTSYYFDWFIKKKLIDLIQ